MDTSTLSGFPNHSVVALTNKLLVGTVKVRLCDLDWSHCSRHFDTEIEKHHRGKPKTNIEAIISEQKLGDTLEASHLTLEELQASSRRGTPMLLTLPQSQKLQCTHGQRRLAAAAEILSKKKQEKWWIVNLYSYSRSDHNVSKGLQYQGEYFDHPTKFSDGEVYKNLSECSINDPEVAKWEARISKSKLIGLRALLRHEDIAQALDALKVFPGILDGLELGNIQKMLALRCDELIICFLRHIKDCWDKITLKENEIKKQVTVEIVHLLQLRAPEASVVDRRYIFRLFKDGVIFPFVSGPKQEAIREAILGLTVIIPSLKSFFENIKYLELGSMVLKAKVFDGNLRTTIQQKAYSKWKPPSTLPVEVQKNYTIQCRNLEKEQMWDLTYKQLWLFILRDFPQLSGILPRKEAGEDIGGEMTFEESNLGGKNPMAEQELAQFVLSLGIRTRKIVAASSHDPKLETLYNCVSKIYSAKPQNWRRSKAEEMLNLLQNQQEVESTRKPLVELCFSSPDGESLERRWGRPFKNAHMSTKDHLYLTNLTDRSLEELESMPTALYVQRDFFNAFFGKTPATAWEDGTGHMEEPVLNSNNADEVFADSVFDEEYTFPYIQQSRPDVENQTEDNEGVAPSPEPDLMNIDNLQGQLQGGFSQEYSVPSQREETTFETSPLSRSQTTRTIVTMGAEKVTEQIQLSAAMIDGVEQHNLSENLEQFLPSQYVRQLEETSTVSQSLRETNMRGGREDAFRQLEGRTPIQSMYNLPASIDSQDDPEVSGTGVQAEISTMQIQGDSFHGQNTREVFTAQASRTPIQSAYNLPATVNVPTAPQPPTQETFQATSPQESSRTPIQSAYNLSATIDVPTTPPLSTQEMFQATSPQDSSRTPIQSLHNLPVSTELSTSLARAIQETEDSVMLQGASTTAAQSSHDLLVTTILPVNLESIRDPHRFRTPIQSMYNLPATVDFLPETQRTSQTIATQNTPRSLIQSVYNLPAISNVLHNMASTNLKAADLFGSQERFRAPVPSTYNLPATVQSFPAELASIEPDINMQHSITRPFENTPPPERERLVQIASQNHQGNSAMPSIPVETRLASGVATDVRGARLENRVRKANPHQFVEYNGDKLVSKTVYKLEDYLKLHKQWYLFGGTSVKQGFIIPPNKRSWYVKKYPAWTFVFVPRKYGEIWKREGAKLMRSFVSREKRNILQLDSSQSVNLNGLADSSRQPNPSMITLGQANLLEFDKVQVSTDSQPDEQLIPHSVQVAAVNQRNDILNGDTGEPSMVLGTFANCIRRYAGVSLLTAEKDLRDTVKPKLGSSMIAFLLYKSSDEWGLLELQRKFVPQILQEMATHYHAFTFDRGRESLSEIGIDVRLAEKAEAFDLWIVPKHVYARFLEQRDRSFDHHFIQFPVDTFESGTGQDIGESDLFEDSESESPESNLHSKSIKSSRSDSIGEKIDASQASADPEDNSLADLPLSTHQNTTEPINLSTNAIAEANRASSEPSSTPMMQAVNELEVYTVTDVVTAQESEPDTRESSVSVDRAKDLESSTKDANIPQEPLVRKRRHSNIEQGDIIRVRNLFDDMIRKPKRAKLHNKNPDGLSRKRTHSEIEQGDIIRLRDVLDDMIRKPKRVRLHNKISEGLSRKRTHSEIEQGDIIEIRDVYEDMVRNPKRVRPSSAAEHVEITKIQDVLDEVLREYQLSETSQDSSNEDNEAEDLEIVE